MSRLFGFTTGAIFGAIVTAVVFQCHLVQTTDRWLIVPRSAVNLKDIYVDVREWTADDWRKHPELSRDLEKAGYAEFQRPETAELENEPWDRLSEHDAAKDPLLESHPNGEFGESRSARRNEDDFGPDSAPR